MAVNTPSRTLAAAFAAIVLLATASAVFAYPSVTVQTSGDTYIATGAVNTVRTSGPGSDTSYSNAWTNTYDYVDGYNDGYSVATRDTWSFAQRYADEDVRYYTIGSANAPYAPLDRTNYYNQYDIYTVPGKECDFGRRDICLFTYTRDTQNNRWQRVGDSDYATYNYYNPYNVPGLYAPGYSYY